MNEILQNLGSRLVFFDGAMGTQLQAKGLLTAMVAAKLCSSNREARQLVQQGGVLVDGEKVTDPTFAFAAEQLQKGVVIKKGKKVYHKVTL